MSGRKELYKNKKIKRCRNKKYLCTLMTVSALMLSCLQIPVYANSEEALPELITEVENSTGETAVDETLIDGTVTDVTVTEEVAGDETATDGTTTDVTVTDGTEETADKDASADSDTEEAVNTDGSAGSGIEEDTDTDDSTDNSSEDGTGDDSADDTDGTSEDVEVYTVTFLDEDGVTVLMAAAEYEYGTAAEDIETPEDPVKESDEQYTYTFAGWDPEITEVTGDAVYTAVYEKTEISEEGTDSEEESQSVEPGTDSEDESTNGKKKKSNSKKSDADASEESTSDKNGTATEGNTEDSTEESTEESTESETDTEEDDTESGSSKKSSSSKSGSKSSGGSKSSKSSSSKSSKSSSSKSGSKSKSSKSSSKNGSSSEESVSGGFAARLAGLTLATTDEQLQISSLDLLLGKNAASRAAKVTWSSLADKAAEQDADAEFVSLTEAGVRLWLPSTFLAEDLTEKEDEAGVIGRYTAEESGAEVLAMYVPADFANISEYAQYVEENGGENMQYLNLNGIDSLLYTVPGVDAFHIAMIMDGQNVLEFSFASFDDEESFDTAQIMAASIQI